MKKDIFIIIDTETTCITVQRGRIAEIAMIIMDENFNITSKESNLIKPNGWTIEKGSFLHRNGFTFEENFYKGVDIGGILQDIRRLSKEYNITFIGYNVSFDIRFLEKELGLIGFGNIKYSYFCLMDYTKKYYRNDKNIKLNEAYQLAFGKEIENHHTAIADAMACYELIKHYEIKP